MRLVYLLCGVVLAELVLFIEVSRHGSRSPINYQPWDTVLRWPNGPGELTSEGIRQQYLVGSYLRNRYITSNAFLSSTYVKSELKLNSSRMSRTIISARSIALGLYPVTDRTMVDMGVLVPLDVSLNSQEATRSVDMEEIVAINTDKDLVDALLRPADHCTEYSEYIKRKKDSKSIRNVFALYKDVVSVVSSHFQISTIAAEKKILDVHDSVICNNFLNYKVPDVFDDKWVQRVNLLYVDLKNYVEYQPDYLARYSGSEFLNHIMKQFDHKILEFSKTKGFVYSAHDSTIMNLFAALGLQMTQQPPFASTLIFELHKVNNEFIVVVIYNDEPLKLPGFGANCTLEQFKELVSIRTFYDVNTACGGIEYVTDPKMPKSQTDEIGSLLLFDLFATAIIVSGIYYLLKKVHKIRV